MAAMISDIPLMHPWTIIMASSSSPGLFGAVSFNVSLLEARTD